MENEKNKKYKIRKFYPPNEITRPLLNMKSRHIQGAGILPFTICPSTKKIFFLLGQEWNINKGLCDFGGRKRFKENVIQTAAREFIEESMAIPLISYGNDRNSISQMLYRGHFLNAIVAEFTRYNNNKCLIKKYVCFLKQVPWNTNFCIDFLKYRGILLRLKKLSEKSFNLNRMIPWSIPFLRPGDPIFNNQSVRCVFDSYYNQEDGSLQILICYGPKKMKFNEKNLEKKWILFKDFTNLYSPINILSEGIILKREKNLLCSIYTDWVKSHNNLLRFYSTLPQDLKHHPGVHVRRERGYISDIVVDPDFLEKSRVEWININDVDKYVDSYDTFKSPDIILGLDIKTNQPIPIKGRFPLRICFIPVLKNAIEIIKKFENTHNNKI